MGGVIQHGISSSFEYLFRPEIQYHKHEPFIAMSEHMSELLTFIILRFKIVLFTRKISFNYQMRIF